MDLSIVSSLMYRQQGTTPYVKSLNRPRVVEHTKQRGTHNKSGVDFSIVLRIRVVI